MELSKILIAAFVVVAVAWSIKRVLFNRSGVFDLFNLPASRYELYSTDLGGEKPKRLSAYGVAGNPDAIFVNSKEVVIGERKSRRAGSQPTHYEIFQVVIYMGLAMHKWPRHKIHARICYANKVLKVNHNPTLFSKLIGLREEILASRRAGKALNRTPLLKR